MKKHRLFIFIISNLATKKNTHLNIIAFQTPGEGTQKIMDYIRLLQTSPNHDSTTRHCIFSVDSDTIMLSLATHELNISILRNEVKSPPFIDIEKTVT